MAFRWQADDRPLVVLLGSTHPLHQLKNEKRKKNVVKVGPL